MNTQRATIQRFDEEIPNAGDPLGGNKSLLLKKILMMTKLLPIVHFLYMRTHGKPFSKWPTSLLLKHNPSILKPEPLWSKLIRRLYPEKTNLLVPWPLV